MFDICDSFPKKFTKNLGGVIFMMVLFLVLLLINVPKARSEIKLFEGGVIPNLNLYSAGFYDIHDRSTGIGALTDIFRWKAFDVSAGYINTPTKDIYVGTVKIALDRIDQIGIKNVTYIWKDVLKSSVGIWAGYSFSDSLKDSERLSYGVMCSILTITY